MADILVVEDEAIVRLLIVETLRNCGHSVWEAADGQAEGQVSAMAIGWAFRFFRLIGPMPQAEKNLRAFVSVDIFPKRI